MPAAVRVKVDYPFHSDAEIADMVRQFEDCSWPFDRWTHRAHLAAGAYYRRHHPFTEALNRIRTSIQRYNKTRGDGTGYHETITTATGRSGNW
jgi:hypothetical protein